MKMRGFLVGLAGGAIGAALVVLLLVLVFNFGEAKETTVVKTTTAPETSSATAPAGEGMSPAQIYKSLSPGVVMVQSTFSGGGSNAFGSQNGQALGTGFVVDKSGYILTNAHVVQDQGQNASSLTIVFNKGGTKTQQVSGQLVGVDDGSDVAVIKVNPSGAELHPLALGNSTTVQVGESVVAIGNPLGYDFSITSGIVSATGRTLDAPNGLQIPNGIQTDAAINPGNSGGPLIDSSGLVIGINEQIASQTGGNEGLGFAVPIDAAIKSMDQLRNGGTVKYAWLGVSGTTLTAEIAKVLNMTPTQGALVEQVSPGGPAAKAGIKAGDRTVTVQGQDFTAGGDIIVKADGTQIAGFDDLIAFLATKKPGDTVTLRIQRGSKTLNVKVKLAQRPSNL